MFHCARKALPNIGMVSVERSGPDTERGYDWTITYVSMPGAFPVNARNLDTMEGHIEYLSGTGAAV